MVHELRNATQTRVDNITRSSIFTALGVYGVIAIAGFCTYGTEVESNILVSYPSKWKTTVAHCPHSLGSCAPGPVACALTHPPTSLLLECLSHCLSFCLSLSATHLVSVGRMFVSLLTAFSFPIVFQPGRNSVLGLWRYTDKDETSWVTYRAFRYVAVTVRPCFLLSVVCCL